MENKSGITLLIILIIVGFVTIGGLTAGYFYWKHQQNQEEQDSVASNEVLENQGFNQEPTNAKTEIFDKDLVKDAYIIDDYKAYFDYSENEKLPYFMEDKNTLYAVIEFNKPLEYENTQGWKEFTSRELQGAWAYIVNSEYPYVIKRTNSSCNEEATACFTSITLEEAMVDTDLKDSITKPGHWPSQQYVIEWYWHGTKVANTRFNIYDSDFSTVESQG